MMSNYNKQIAATPPPAAVNALSTMQNLIKGDRSNMGLIVDNLMMRQIMETHIPGAAATHDVRPLLRVVEDIFARTTNMTPTTAVDHATTLQGAHVDNMDDRINQTAVTSILESMSHIIDRISCEMSINSLGGSDGHMTTINILKTVSSHPWDAKLVLTLAAFGLSYGEFWLLTQIYSSNQLARSMAILKQVPSIMEHLGSLKPRFDAVNKLLSSVLDLTRTILAVEELPSAYISKDAPPMSTTLATFPVAVYWSVRSVIACAAQISGLTNMSLAYTLSMTELAWELETLAQRIKQIHDYIKQQLDICQQHIDSKISIEAYESLNNLFKIPQIDNMKVLKALIYPKDDILPLVEGSSKRKVSLDVLRRKNVLLLISGLDMSPDELLILEQIYSESRNQGAKLESLYEVVWMPIVDLYTQHRISELVPLQKRLISTTTSSLPERKLMSSSSIITPMIPMTNVVDRNSSAVFRQRWTESMEERLEKLRSTMPWYSVCHPSIIHPTVVKFVKERWHLRNRPTLVVLDQQGRELSPNAIHMMWIWGTTAFPFTSLKEEALWREETWRLELLVSGMDPTIYNNWIKEGKYIILYGGEDIDWIRRFTKTALSVAQTAGISLEMAYVGKSTKKEMVRKAMSTISIEKLSYCWQDPSMMWFFWTRLESMLFSKIQVKKMDDHQDPLMQEIKKILSYDKSGSWALLCKGSVVVTGGHAQTMLNTFENYGEWKEHVPIKGFDVAYKEYHERLHVANLPCCRFEFLTTAGRVPDGMRCPECLREMTKYNTFLCCHEESTVLGLPYN